MTGYRAPHNEAIKREYESTDLLTGQPGALGGCMLQGTSEMVRNTRHHDIWLEKQRSFDEEGVLIVQQVLPQTPRHELRKYDRDISSGLNLLEVFDVVEQWFHQGPIG